jgi:hypothetical protein
MDQIYKTWITVDAIEPHHTIQKLHSKGSLLITFLKPFRSMILCSQKSIKTAISTGETIRKLLNFGKQQFRIPEEISLTLAAMAGGLRLPLQILRHRLPFEYNLNTIVV